MSPVSARGTRRTAWVTRHYVAAVFITSVGSEWPRTIYESVYLVSSSRNSDVRYRGPRRLSPRAPRPPADSLAPRQPPSWLPTRAPAPGVSVPILDGLFPPPRQAFLPLRSFPTRRL